MKVEFESELQKAKQNLDLERQNVRETLDSEYQGERDRLKSEIKLLRSLLHAEETKNAELSGRNKQATEYAEDLESRLVASEVEKEELQVEVTRLKQEAEDMKLKHEEELQREVQAREQLETTSKEGQKTVEAYKGDMLRHVEEAKYEMFRQLMDVFEKERAVLEKAHARTQELLTLAAKVGFIVLRGDYRCFLRTVGAQWWMLVVKVFRARCFQSNLRILLPVQLLAGRHVLDAEEPGADQRAESGHPLRAEHQPARPIHVIAALDVHRCFH
jgi:cell division ATPase FtsA